MDLCLALSTPLGTGGRFEIRLTVSPIKILGGTSLFSSGYDSVFPMMGAPVQSLVQELDST